MEALYHDGSRTLQDQFDTRRLADDVTSGREDNLRGAREQAAAGAGVGIEDLRVVNDRPVAEVALEVLAWLGWI